MTTEQLAKCLVSIRLAQNVANQFYGLQEEDNNNIEMAVKELESLVITTSNFIKVYDNMRSATAEENQSVTNYVASISKHTMNFPFEDYDELGDPDE